MSLIDYKLVNMEKEFQFVDNRLNPFRVPGRNLRIEGRPLPSLPLTNEDVGLPLPSALLSSSAQR